MALGLPDQYYLDLAARYQRRRDVLLEILERHHFTCYKPFGAYYIMTDISAFGFSDDVEFARYLVKDVGVAAVPGSSFYKDAAKGRTKLRFCFCKRDETLAEADKRLETLVPASAPALKTTTKDTHAAFVLASVVAHLPSVPRDHPEIDPLQLERPGVGVDDVADVERPVADLRADVVREVHRAVDVDVDVVRMGVLDEMSGSLNPVTSPVIEMFGTT